MTARSLSLREKRLIQGAILLAIIVLVSLLLRGGGGGAPPPEPVAPLAPMPIAPIAPPVAAAPAPPPVPAADLSQLRLYGLLASGAVLGYANGGQRLVPVGREALPGLILVRVEQNHAVFQSVGGEIRLGFDGIAQPDMSSGAASAPAPVATGAAAQREETLRYRLGLAPRREGGRVTGYTVRSNVEMPALARAGIRPGDIIVSVDGGVFDEQRLQELASIVAGAARTRIEVERDGRRLQLSLSPR
jgi:type II secretory pathway component PulC